MGKGDVRIQAINEYEKLWQLMLLGLFTRRRAVYSQAMTKLRKTYKLQFEDLVEHTGVRYHESLDD